VAYSAASLRLVAMRQLCWPCVAVVIVRFVRQFRRCCNLSGRLGFAISIAALVVATRFLRAERPLAARRSACASARLP